MKGTYSLSLTSEQINTALNRVHNEDFIEKDSLDSTLSEQGAPAESKAIGDRLTEVLGYIASPYDSSKTYKAKDLCSYENQIYICVTDINKPEWFNKDHWTSVTLGAALTSITQMEDLITHLITLRGLTAGEFEVIAQSGQARGFFKVGDVIYIPWTDYNVDPAVEYEIPHIIVDFIDAIGEDGYTYETSPVLEWMYATPTSLPFDAVERVAVNEGEVIEAGYYYFEFVDPSYVLLNPQPSVGSAVPAGKTYYKHIWANASSAIRFGLNSYHLSAYRQWLNADVGLNTGWWSAQHDSDCSPTNYVDYAGFLYGYDESWKRVFTRTEVKTKGNTDIFGGEVDIDYDYFFLPAISQIGGSQTYATITGDAWEYWETILAENYPAAVRTAYDAYKIPTYPGNTDPATMRLRSCKVAYVGDTYTMTNEGILNDYGHSNGSYKALPATIILGKKKYRVIVSEDDPQSIASFVDEEGDMPVDLTAAIVPVQSGSGDPSPTNIRPISGWTECKTTRAGKNLLKTTATTTTQEGVTWTVNDDGSITASGTPTAYSGITAGEADVYGIKGIVNIFANVSNANNVAFANISLYDKNNTLLYRVYAGGFETTHTVDLSQYPECKYIRVGLKRNNNNVAVSGTYTIQVELGSAATDFEPYRGDTYTVTFGSAGTVYGGTLDVTTGTLTVTWAIVDLGTLTWERHASYSELFTGRQLDPIAKYVSGAGTVRHICSIYKSETSTSVIDVDYSVAISGNGRLVYVHDSSYSTPQEFTAAMSGVQLVYELNEPLVYHLTPVEILTLAGENTIWADTGDIKKLIIGIK